MDLSVVICTRNRAAHLHSLFEKLRGIQSHGIQWELILVDNNSNDGTLAMLREFSLTFLAPTRVIHEPKNGLSNARNAGWKAACGEIVSFTDDDCYPDQDWLISIVKSFENSDAGYVGGRVLLFDSDDAPITIQTSEEHLVFPKNSHIESGQIIGANFSFKRKVLEVSGGFDPRLGAGTAFHSGEDTDLLMRASALGFTGRYDPSIVVFHHHRRKLEDDVKKLYRGYAFGRGALSVKTITESDARKMHLKFWYWRLYSLFKKGEFSYITSELRGATAFMLNGGPRPRSTGAAAEPNGTTSRVEIKDFEEQGQGLPQHRHTVFANPLVTELSAAEPDQHTGA